MFNLEYIKNVTQNEYGLVSINGSMVYIQYNQFSEISCHFCNLKIDPPVYYYFRVVPTSRESSLFYLCDICYKKIKILFL